MTQRNTPAHWAFAVFTYLFLYAPIAVVIVFSFNAARLGAGWSGFTTKWYSVLLDNPQALSAAKNSVLLAVFSTLIATVLGTLLAFGLKRGSARQKRLLPFLVYPPIFVPDIVIAVAFLLLFSLTQSWLGIFKFGLLTMVVGHVTLQLPFVAIVVRARLAGMDPSLEEAAQDLGANARKVFTRVTFPLILPGILAGALLAFTLSLDDFVVSFFTSGPGSTTLPILIYSSVKRGITPDINALSTLLIAASIIGTVSSVLLQRKAKT